MNKRILKALSFVLVIIQCICTSVFTMASAEETADLPQTITIDLMSYHNGIVGGQNTGTISKSDFDSKSVVKIVPNVNSTEKTLKIDGWNYNKAEIDFAKYHWMAIEYYYDSPNPLSWKMNIGIMTSNILEKNYYKLSDNSVVSGRWDYAFFDLSGVRDVLKPNLDKYYLKQMHLEPLGNSIPLNERSADEALYIGKLMFFAEKPDFGTHKPYMKGYDDGTFKPSGTMTRAEACTVIARLLEEEDNIKGKHNYSDVTDSDWFAKYVGFCNEKGLLTAFGGDKFEPSKAITRAEFALLVYLTELSENGTADIKFNDVDSSHPFYESIMAAAGAGLINGYQDGTFGPDKTVTRAEVVTIINRAMKTSKIASGIPSGITMLFLDVDDTHWAFADIAEATVEHTYWNNEWMYVLEDPVDALLKKVDPNLIFDYEGGKNKIAELDALEGQRVAEIRASESNVNVTDEKIYVSSIGNDSNDGKSEQTPVKTISKANELVSSGGAVLLRRGDIFRERFSTKAGVTYSAYGSGDKPKVYGSPENGADASKWSLVYKGNDGALIWKYANESMKDVGSIIFNNGEGYAVKELPSSKGSQFIVRGSDDKQYVYTEQLDKNFEFFHGANSVVSGSYIDPVGASGPLYLRCDNGNPGVVFDSVEFAENGHIVRVYGNNVTIDNLCIMYGGSHGIYANTIKNLTVSNCEIGFIGGSVQKYGYGGRGMALRYGNGVEIYGGCDGYTVTNSYIYQCYDAGLTHQYSSDNESIFMNNVKYTDNVITDCIYSVEYWLKDGNPEDGNMTGGFNHTISGNIFRRAGFGFGSTRTDTGVARHIASGENPFENVSITNNVFDRSEFELVRVCFGDKEASVPYFDGNTYIQGYKNKLYTYGLTNAINGYIVKGSQKSINIYIGDKNAKVFFVPGIQNYTYSFTTDQKDTSEYEVIEDDVSIFEEVAEEVLPPYFVKSAKNNSLYVKTTSSVNASNLAVDKDTGIRYKRFTPKNDPAAMVLDCYGLNPKIPFTSGQVFIKVLLRTNHSSIIHLNIHNISDAEGNTLSGAAIYTQSKNKTVANGEWEEIIIPVTNINSAYAASSQVRIQFFSNKGTGASFYEDGKLKDNVYCDIAAWGVFANYTSAEAGSLVEEYNAESKEENTEDDSTASADTSNESVIPPVFVRSVKNNSLYVNTTASVNTSDVSVSPEMGIIYKRFTPKNDPAVMVLDCYGLNPKIPFTDNQAYIKILLRTNHSSIIHLNIHNIEDKTGNKISGAAIYTQSKNKTVGNEEWEEIIIHITNVKAEYAASSQARIQFFSNKGTGESFYENGKLKDDVYCDIAAWGVFEDLASAENTSLVSYAR